MRQTHRITVMLRPICRAGQTKISPVNSDMIIYGMGQKIVVYTSMNANINMYKMGQKIYSNKKTFSKS